MLTTDLSNALRAVSGALQTPVIIILLLLIAITILLAGSLIGEVFTERRHMKQNMPQLVDSLRECAGAPADSGDEAVQQSVSEKTAEVIKNSRLLKRQKKALVELTAHDKVTPLMRESLAVRLMHEERAHYERILKISDVIAKIGPMFGLLGTLIPLGPGIIALGQGDTYTLSNSLLTAFDTTVAGLICAAAAFLISAIRRTWYSNYMSALEMSAECVLEVMKLDEGSKQPASEKKEEE